MKRAVLFAVMILFVFSFAAQCEEEALYCGGWYMLIDSDDAIGIKVIYLKEDHSAYYVYEILSENEIKGDEHIGTWEVDENGIASITFENGEKIGAKLKDDGNLWTNEGNYLYSHSYVPSTSKNDPRGLRVPMGEYLIGEYIPAGNYRVTLTGKDLAVVWVYKKGAFSGQYYSLVYKTGETVANIRLSDGDTFKVEHATVILSDMTGL